MDVSFLEKRFQSSWFAFILIGFSVLIIYSNVYKSPFTFDDRPRIVENKTIRNVSNYLSSGRLLEPRAVVDLTFALNYKFGKLNVFGYHLINILIHIINSFLVYFLVFAILKQRPESTTSYNHSISGSSDVSIGALALFAAMIFAVHPIQTQAVTYIAQRYASMAAMFYMGSMLCYIYARTFQRRSTDQPGHKLHISGLYILSIGCGILAFLSKQNTATLPGAILLVEYVFIDRTWQGWKKKIPWFVLAFTGWLLIILFVSGLFSGTFGGRNLLEDVSSLTKETATVSRWNYLFTQFNVLVIYIRLLFFPVNQNLDYMYPFKAGFFDGLTPLAFIFLLFIAGLGIWNIKRRPVVTFGIFFFFITLSVESSIIPIKDALFEHRLYLPMFGFGFVVSYLMLHYLSNNKSLALVLLLSIILFLGAATYRRNMVWQDEVTLWSDVVAKSPQNYRAHHSLGFGLKKQGRTKEAIEQYLQALRIKPEYVDAHNNLGVALFEQGRTKEAIEQYLQALRIKPEFEGAHNNLGNAFSKQGRMKEAIEQYLQALRINPDFERAHNNLGVALARTGSIKMAIYHFQEALRINPDSVPAKNNLKRALIIQQQNR